MKSNHHLTGLSLKKPVYVHVQQNNTDADEQLISFGMFQEPAIQFRSELSTMQLFRVFP